MDKFQILQARALLVKSRGGITVANGRARGLAEQQVLSARGHDGGIGIDRFRLAFLFVVENGAVAFAVGNECRVEMSAEQAADEPLALVFSRLADHGRHDLLAR